MSIRDTSDADIRFTSQGDRRVTSQGEGPPPTPSIPGAALGAAPGLQLVLYEAAGGRSVVDFSPDVMGLVASDGPHGYEMLQANVDLILRQAARHYGDKRVLHASLNFGPETVWEGRLEDRRLNDSGLGLSSFGYWRAMFDAPYSALWSKTGAAGWVWATSDNNAGFVPERYEGDNNNRLYIAPRQDEDYDDSSTGAWTFATPHNGERSIVAIDFDYTLDAPADWVGYLSYADHDIFTPTLLFSVTSSGAPLVGTMSLTTAPASTKQRLIFGMYNNNITPTTFTGETGSAYFKITNLRIATTTTHRVNTTLGTTILAGSQTVTPASMANIYLGQQLRIKQNTITAETVVVTAVTATTFTATFANAHVTTDAVNAIVVYADEIAESLVDFVETLNPGHISDSKASIEAHGVDLTDELYEDAFPADILNDLAARGDGNGQQWEVGIRNGRRLFFRPKGSNGATWYVDAAGLELERTLNNVANSVYSLYRDNNDMTRRTDAADNDLSIRQYGLTRRMAFPASTTRLVQAEEYRTAALAYYSNPPPRQVVEFDELWTAGGALVRHKWQVRAGDTIVLRNVDPTLLADDQAITFRIGRVHYDAATNRLAVEPEIVTAPYIAMLINGAEFVPRELPEGYLPGMIPYNPPNPFPEGPPGTPYDPGDGWPGHPEGSPYDPGPGWPGH